MTRYSKITTVDDVTDEIIAMAQEIYAGWYNNSQRIDWDNFLDRLDGSQLEDGSIVDLGNDMGSPAIRKIQGEIRAYRKLDT